MNNCRAVVKRVLHVASYWVGIGSLFYRLNRRAKRVIVFHNVIRDELAGGIPKGVVGMRLSEFAAVIDEIGKHFRISNDIFDPSTVTLTFDDGYRNQYSTAFKYLQARNIPGVLFFSPGTRNVLTIDKMVLWREMVPRSLIPCGDIGKFWAEQFWPRYMEDGESRGRKTLAWLNSIYSCDDLMAQLPREFVHERFGSILNDELDEMRGAGWTIGWHTKTHTPLSTLDVEGLQDELSAPPEFRDVCMAYPYGTEAAVGKRAISIVAAQGFPCAFAYTNSSDLNKSRFFLPRLPSIGADRYLLNAQLSGFQYFMSYRRLMPTFPISESANT